MDPSPAASNVEEFGKALEAFTLKVVPEKAHALQTVIAMTALDRLIKKTPVNTGRLRAAWITDIGSVSGAGHSASGGAADAAYQEGSAKILAAPVYSFIAFFNNLPYLEVVENGGFRPKDPSNEPDAMELRAKGRSEPRQRQAVAFTGTGHPGGTFVKGGYSIQAPHGMIAVTFQELIQAFGSRGDTDEATGGDGPTPKPKPKAPSGPRQRDSQGRFLPAGTVLPTAPRGPARDPSTGRFLRKS